MSKAMMWTELAKTQKDNVLLHNEVASLTEKCQAQAKQLAEWGEEFEELGDDFDQARQDLKDEESDHEATRQKLGRLEAAHRRLAQEQTLAQPQANRDNQAEADAAQATLLRTQKEELLERLGDEKAEVADLKARLALSEERAEDAEAQAQELQAALDAKRTELAKLEDKLEPKERLFLESVEALAAETLEAAKLRAANEQLANSLEKADRRSQDTKRHLEKAARRLEDGPERPADKRARRASAEAGHSSTEAPARAPVAKVREPASNVPADLGDLVARCPNTALDADAVSKWQNASSETRALALELGQLPPDTKNTSATVMGLVTACEYWRSPSTRGRVTKRFREPLEALEQSRTLAAPSALDRLD